MMPTKILLIEDDFDISETVSTYLRESGLQVTQAYDGQAGLNAFSQGSFDCVLLDLMLPKKNGIEVLIALRSQSFVPVIILSAKETEYDKSVALELGADDYLTKPFSFVELKARIQSCIRRSTQYRNEPAVINQIVYQNYTMTLDAHTLVYNNKELKLTATEFDILRLFFENPTRVFTKEDIYQSVWKESYYGDENIVNVHMKRLRDKIDVSETSLIETLWGIGYRLHQTVAQS